MKRTWPILLGLLLLAAPAAVHAQFTYTTNNGMITLAKYTGFGGAVVISNFVTSIGSNAFASTSLTSVTIPASVTTIGDDAFWDCWHLMSVTIPNSVSNIGDAAFGYCSSLQAITVAATNSFYCSVAGVLFDISQATLMQYPAGKAGSSYIIPNTVTNIGDYAFFGCSALTNLTIPSSVTSIGDAAFWCCTLLTNVIIPNSVTNIRDGAFGYCSNLLAITVAATNSFYSSLAGVLFDISQTTLLQYPAGKMGNSYIIPNTVTNIGDYAFFGCSALTNLTIPNSVTNIGEAAFEGCTCLTSVTIPNSVTGIGDGTFYSCTGLTSVTIPNSVTSIGEAAFAGCTSLTSVTIPNSVSSIREAAFADCTKLTSVCFTGNPPTLGSSVFDFDNKLTVYYLPGTTGWGSTFGGRPAVLWNPGISTGDASFGVQTNYFGFNITGTNNYTVVVEACTNLASPVWVRLATNTLANGVFHFSEPFQANSPGRFYGLGFP
jgi:hypothetical protein